ncbi:hypothetical protein KOW79_004676 [Hemibagrus wyckioides]|uniref:DUF4590 domain-containing protein n=1 Tax=Hemibagrus wyckioides TaxID=337641 RepID=A0A9D3SQI5_9TELE|nr:hypothetical protein KOW79_004676 [Hemibagrus wyckioides]
MSHLTPGLIGAYNSLTDKHLTAYFNNVRIRRHLQRVGLISRSGRVVSEKEFRYKIIHRDQQRHVRECLAQAIFHRVLDMEVERCNRYEDDPVIILSPRPPTRLRSSHARHSGPEREPSDSTDSLDSSRPNTAPEKTQRPVRLKPLNCNSIQTSTKRNSSRSQNHEVINEREEPISCIMDRDVMRHLTLTDFSSSVSPYRLPVINNFVTPVPPRKRKDNLQSGTLRVRRLRPTTAPSDAPDMKEGAVQRAWSRSVVWVKMVYFGKSVHLSHELVELKDEVKVFQQHCGGENLCVYKGRLKEGESFQFVSRRHHGFPFSLTFYLNGLQVERLSSCCEFKHRKNSRLGGRHAHFGFSGVEGATPCYRCIIAMGLDKKPTPPKKIRNDPLVSRSWENEEEEEKCSQSESSQSHNTESKRNTNQEHTRKNGFEEDFEADDEGPMDDGVDEGNETSPSLIREEEDERRKDENGDEDLKRNKVRGSSSVSSDLSSNEEDEEEFEEENKKEELKTKRHMATLTSKKNAEETENLQIFSTSQLTKNETPNQEMEHTEREDGEDEEPREAEECTDDAEEAKESRNESVEAEEPIDKPGEADEPRGEPGEAEEPRGEPGETEEPGEAQKAREDLREGRDVNVNKEADQAKSVQEKFAEALLMAEGVSEPELSDSTTEEDELVSVEIQQLGPVPGAEPESNMAQQTTDEENGAEDVLKADREQAHAEEPKEEPDTQETPEPETKAEEKENDTDQTEEKSQNTTDEDEHVQDEQNNSYATNEDQKPEIKPDRTDGEEEQKQEENNFTNKEKSNEETEMMEKSENKEQPDEEVPKPEKETINENSVNSAETRAAPVDEEVSMMEETTALLPENRKETSVNHENMEQNIELEKGLYGENVCAEGQVNEEVRADEEETFAEESRNLRNNAEETGNAITECVEGDIEKSELKIKPFSVNEVNYKDVTCEGEKSEETVKVPEAKGEETEVRNGVEEDKDELTDKGNNEDNREVTEDREDQKESISTGQTSDDKAENDVGEREEELTAEKDVELKADQVSVSEGNNTEDKKHEQELKQNESLKETEVGENEQENMSKDGEERIDVDGADTEMQELVMKQEDNNKEEQNANSASSVHEALQETNDGPGVKPGGLEAEHKEEIITVDQEELDKKEAAGPGEGEGWYNEEEINGDMVQEGLKEEEINDDNEKEEDQKEIHQETTNEEDEEQEVSEEEFEQKQNIQQETTNEEDVKDEQKDKVEKVQPLISENDNNAATKDEPSSEAKTSAEDPAGAESEPKDTNVDLKEKESRGGADNHMQSSTDYKKDKSTDAPEESRSVEGSISPSEGSQPVEKDLVVKREERVAELIVAPRTDHEELVSNWVNVHQESNYFETFVEPLDEIKILDSERTGNTEAQETDKSPRNEESSENAKSEQISLLEISEHEDLQDTVVENFNMETEALGVEERNPASRNPSEEEEIQKQIDSEQPPEDQEDVAVNKVMNISATPLMKTEISQDS